MSPSHPLHSYMTLVTLNIRSKSRKKGPLNDVFAPVLSKYGHWVTEDRVQTMLFHSYMNLVTLKIRSRSSNLTIFFFFWFGLMLYIPVKIECIHSFFIVI